MRLIDKIDEIMQKDFCHSSISKSSKLIELHPLSNCRDITLKGSGDLLVYKFDTTIKINGKEVNKFPLFQDGNPKRIADYLTFYQPINKNELYVFICEMKTTNTNGALNQMMALKILANYIVDTARRCLNFDEIEKPKFRGFLFSSAPTYKANNQKLYNEGFGELKYTSLQCGLEYLLDAYCHNS